MTRQKLYIISILVLLCCNAWSLYHLFVMPSHKPVPPRKIIIEKLQFSESQIEAYDILIAEHQKSIRDTEGQIKSAKSDLYQLLKLSVPDSALMANKIAHISALQASIEYIHMAHFADIKNLCNANQLPQFDSLVNELANLFGRNRRKNQDKHE